MWISCLADLLAAVSLKPLEGTGGHCVCGRRQEQSKWEKGIDLNVDGCLDTLKRVGGERKLSPWEEEEGQAGRKIKLEARLLPGCLRACDVSQRAPQSCCWPLYYLEPPLYISSKTTAGLLLITKSCSHSLCRALWEGTHTWVGLVSCTQQPKIVDSPLWWK